MTRDEKRKPPSTRGDLDIKGSGFSTGTRGTHGSMIVRDVSSGIGALGSTPDINELADTVRRVIDLINGPVAREIHDIGRYMNERGEYVGP